MKITSPVNDLQQQFNELCDKGGGVGGGPARTKVQQLLFSGSRRLNTYARDEISAQLDKFSDPDPWKVCFAVGLGWGHLAQICDEFTDAATEALSTLDGRALREASRHHLERGPGPIEQSLRGGYQMFQRVKLPENIPDQIMSIGRAQERWLSPILGPNADRPKYIGSWNATAMFMVSLFAKPDVASKMAKTEVMLPPGGPIYLGMTTLYKAHLLPQRPAGSELDDQAFEPGAIYENNALMDEFRKGFADWTLLDVHSGIYMLGTRHRLSAEWL